MTQHKTILTPKRIHGAALVLVAWIFFTVAIALSRPAGERTSIPMVLLFQNFISLIVVTPWVLSKGRKGFRLSKYGVFLIRAIAGFLSFTFTYLAVQRISLVNAILLSNTAPLFIPLLIWMWRRVKISKQLWIGILLGFIGIAIILKPNSEMFDTGALFALAAALCFSISMISQRRLLKTEKLRTVLFYYFLVSTMISVPFAIESWQPIDRTSWILLLVIGGCFIVGQLCFLSALQYEKPSFLSAFNYSGIVYGALFEWIVWNKYPGWVTILGVIVVCTGGLIAISKRKDQ